MSELEFEKIRENKIKLVTSVFNSERTKFEHWMVSKNLTAYCLLLKLEIIESYNKKDFGVHFYFYTWRQHRALGIGFNDEQIRHSIIQVFTQLRSYIRNTFIKIEPFLDN